MFSTMEVIMSTVGDIMMHVGDIMSTVGVFSTVGDIMSTMGVFSTMERYHDASGGYLEYRGGVQYCGVS